MKLSLIITQNCVACTRAESILNNLVLKYPELSLRIINANDYTGKGISIVPALLIEDELYSYGDIEEPKLLSYISRRHNTLHKNY